MCCDWRKRIVNVCYVFKCSVVTLSLACISEELSHGILATYKIPPLFPVVHLSVGRSVSVISAYEPSGPSVPELIPVSVAKRLDGMLVHRRLPLALNSPAPIYTPGWREAP